MRVKELITLLEQLEDPEADIYISDSEYGAQPVDSIERDRHRVKTENGRMLPAFVWVIWP